VSAALYDAILVVSFGGPEGPDDVLPFMENVTRGRGIPPARLVEVSQHYQLFGGVSPINEQNRQLIAALRLELDAADIHLPIYWGNRNWHPLLSDTVEQMHHDGVRRAIAFVTSAYSSSSGCRQYRENIADALSTSAADGLSIDKIRVFYNHPGFIGPLVDATVAEAESLAAELGSTEQIHFACTAHSIPMSMANTSDYVKQLTEASRLVCEAAAERLGAEVPWTLSFQSRSGPPEQPWLEPDISDRLSQLQTDGARGVVMVPVGFISDHMEVIYDLDTQAAAHANQIGLPIRRAATPGIDPRFVSMVRELIEERIQLATGVNPLRKAIGRFAANHDVCPLDCCPTPQRPPTATRPSP
jgi:protoporphyrin/coproporphyrin ferrochelatase